MKATDLFYDIFCSYCKFLFLHTTTAQRGNNMSQQLMTFTGVTHKSCRIALWTAPFHATHCLYIFLCPKGGVFYFGQHLDKVYESRFECYRSFRQTKDPIIHFIESRDLSRPQWGKVAFVIWSGIIWRGSSCLYELSWQRVHFVSEQMSNATFPHCS